MTTELAINLTYILAALFFVIGLKMLSRPGTARRGNLVSAIGMLAAIVVTLLDRKSADYHWIIGGLAVGTAIGVISARIVKMTQMPGMVGLLNGFGGLASLLVGCEADHSQPTADLYTAVTVFLAVLIGGVTFSGSVVAWAKVGEHLSGKPFVFLGQRWVNGLLLAALLAGGVLFCRDPSANYPVFVVMILLSLVLGIMVVIPIGGADMPVVISLLNSYSGMAGCATGFVILNNMLIVAGALVGASGIILTQIMCRAMNRSLANVLFSGFGSVTAGGGSAEKGEAKALSTEEAAAVLEAARSIVFVPGYGMAVAQAQHVVRELGDLLGKNGAEIRYAIHPVAGRMPGHMNVLLAEANVSYDQLVEMDDINRTIETVDVCIVIGANDVVNPAAREDPKSPIYGMPIIEVDRSRLVLVLKRSMAAGFAGIENPLFYRENTRMVFGDAKATVSALINGFKGLLAA